MCALKYRVGIISDLHLDDRNTNKHKNYFANCCNICKQITEMIEREGITHLIFLGDLFGNTQHIVKKQSTRVHFTEYFANWNKYTNGNVYSVAGNHDRGAYATDFDLLCASGLVKHPRELELDGACFHFIDYGEDTRAIQLRQGSYNIALMHAHLTIEGQTDYIRIQGGTPLSELTNLAGCSLVVCGHIHNPSGRYMTTRIANQPVSLYYPGNPTRPRKEPDLWETASMLVFECDDDGTVCERAVDFALAPIEDLFFTVDKNGVEVVEDETQVNVEVLGQILQNLQNYQLVVNGGYKEQLERFGAMDVDAKNMALQYIEKAASSDTESGNPNI